MRATIGDVAAAAGVSEATVSRALRGLPGVAKGTRDRVLEVARDLDYVANPHAARLASSRPSVLGVVLPYIDRWYYSTFFAAVTRRLEASTFDVVPLVLEGDPGTAAFVEELPRHMQTGGLILVDIDVSESTARGSAASRVPVVTVNVETPVFSSLLVDNESGTQSAVEHLISLGHERIGLIGAKGSSSGLFRVADDRRTGYRRALERAGLTVDPDLMVGGDYTAAGGAAAMRRLLDLDDRPTAVHVLSDEMAVGALNTLRAVGVSVPDDMSVVGFDDHDLAEFLGLTTVRQDVVGAAWRSVDLLLGHLGGDSDVVHERLPTRLIVRATSARRVSPNRRRA